MGPLESGAALDVAKDAKYELEIARPMAGSFYAEQRVLIRMICFVMAAFSCSCFAAPPSGAEQVFKIASPSVVVISDDEGSGSGVVVNSSGLILTNPNFPIYLDAADTFLGNL